MQSINFDPYGGVDTGSYSGFATEREYLNHIKESIVEHFRTQPIDIVDEDNSARESLTSRLDELLGKYEPAATNYLMAKGYLKAGQNYRDLDAMTAQRMLASPAKIIGILEGIK